MHISHFAGRRDFVTPNGKMTGSRPQPRRPDGIDRGRGDCDEGLVNNGEHGGRLSRFSKLIYRPKRRDACIFLVGVICAAAVESIKAYDYLRFVNNCIVYLGARIPDAWKYVTPEEARLMGRRMIQCRLAMAFLQALHITVTCYRNMKDFDQCPICFSDKPRSPFQIVRPQHCRHFGCMSCMVKWHAEPKYSGCALCRKGSSKLFDIASEINEGWRWLYPIWEAVWFYHLILLMYLHAFDGIESNPTLIGCCVVLCCCHLLWVLFLGHGFVFQLKELLRSNRLIDAHNRRIEERERLRLQYGARPALAESLVSADGN